MFFIIGIARSGTTLLERILDNHSKIAVCPESNAFPSLSKLGANNRFTSVDQYSKFIQLILKRTSNFNDPANETIQKHLHQFPNYTGNTQELLASLVSEYLKKKNKVNFGEKTPENVFYINKMYALCPKSKFVFLLRNPLDLVRSISQLLITSQSAKQTNNRILLKAATIVKHGLINIYKENNILDSNKIFVTYEGFVNHPEKTIAMICHFLDVEPENNILLYDASNYVSDKNVSLKAAHANLKKPILRNRANTYHEHLTIFQIKLLTRFLEPLPKESPYNLKFKKCKLGIRNNLLLFEFKIKYYIKYFYWKDYLERIKSIIKYKLLLN